MPPDAASAQYDFLKLIFAALFGFALGVAGNIITFFVLNPDSYIRSLDRETKKLAFWKAMRELKTDISEETGLSQEQITALNQRFKLDLQKSIDVMMGWEMRAHHIAASVAWLATMAFAAFTAKGLWPFLEIANRMGLKPGTLEYNVISISALVAVFYVVFHQLLFRPIYERVKQRAVRLMREHPGNFNFWMILYK
jgi:hypothetical protein